MATYNHTIYTGQSLAVGSGGAVSGAVPDGARMLAINGSTGVPQTWTAPATYEPPARQLIEQVVEYADPSYLMTLHNTSIGASTYADLKKGGAKPAFADSITVVQNGHTYLTGQGHALLVRAVHITHGTGDDSGGTTRAQYAGYLDEWLSDYNTDCKAITGQADDLVAIVDQFTAGGGSDISFAQRDATVSNPNIYLVGPRYPLPYKDSVHLTPAGYHYLGELHARAHNKLLIDGEPWEPVHPSAVATYGAASVVVDFHVPTPPLQFDTTSLSPVTNMGFSLHDAGACLITDVEITGGSQVTVHLNTNPPVGAVLAYGRVSEFGNLRDSETAVSSLDSEPLPNWCCHFDQEIANVANPSPSVYDSVEPRAGGRSLLMRR